jgi:hypothetical protein
MGFPNPKPHKQMTMAVEQPQHHPQCLYNSCAISPPKSTTNKKLIHEPYRPPTIARMHMRTVARCLPRVFNFVEEHSIQQQHQYCHPFIQLKSRTCVFDPAVPDPTWRWHPCTSSQRRRRFQHLMRTCVAPHIPTPKCDRIVS